MAASREREPRDATVLVVAFSMVLTLLVLAQIPALLATASWEAIPIARYALRWEGLAIAFGGLLLSLGIAIRQSSRSPRGEQQ